MIEFAGRTLESFDRVRVLRVADGFQSDFDQQTLVDGGQMPASISVPSIRVFEVEFLVRGSTHQEIQEKIITIADFLKAQGVAKLYTRRSKLTYYLARCVSFDPPVYNGLSAEVRVSFSCTDHRPYNAATNAPNGSLIGGKVNNFTLAGKHILNDLGCLFFEDSRTAIPQVDAPIYKLPGMSGTIRYTQNHPTLTEKKVTGTLFFVNVANPHQNIQEQDVYDKLHTVSSFIASAGRADILFDNDITRRYKGEVITNSEFTRDNWNNGSIRLTIILQPIAEDVTVSTSTKTASLAANTEAEISFAGIFQREVGFETPLRIEITNTGTDAINDLTISYMNHNNENASCRFAGGDFVIPKNGVLVIDTEKTEAKVAGTNVLPSLVSGELPKFYPAPIPRTLWLKSTFATSVSVKITANGRWV